MDALGGCERKANDGEIGQADRQRALGRCRIERQRVGKSGRDFLHRTLDRTGELAGARRRLHAAGGANEEIILEEVAQAVEGVAHRRLGDADARRGKLHPPLGKQRVERLEQVEVDRSNILHMNFIDAKY